jgi:uncharacterized protein (DUF1499 family)
MLYVVLAVVAVPLLLAVLAVTSRPGDAPGILDGKLRPCGRAANAVCSEDPNPALRVDPIHMASDESWQRLKTAITQLGGDIENEADDYLWATFRSPVFGFVDDVEARRDTDQGLIHVRSASRVGHSDLGVNRRRIEQLHELMKQ